MRLNIWFIKQRMRAMRKRIQRDVRVNEAKARERLLRALPPLLSIFDVEDTFTDENGKEVTRSVTLADLETFETPRLVELMESLITELEQKV